MTSVEIVKSICKERGISIAQFERDLGFSNGYIGQLRKGVFPTDRLAAIAEYLHVDANVLLGISKPSGTKSSACAYTEQFIDNVWAIVKNADASDAEAIAMQPGYLESIFDSRFALSLEDACNIADRLGHSVDELVGNEKTPFAESDGGLHKITTEARKIAEDFDVLDEWGKEHIRSTIKIEVSRLEEVRAKHVITGSAKTAQLIPFRLSLQPASAGTGAYLGPEAFETVFVEPTELTRKASFGVRVSGDSMEPRYHDGDVLVVERADDIAIGDIGIFTVRGDGYVKQRGRGELISLNPDYDPIPMTEDTRCNGRVIGTIDPSKVIDA